MTIHDDLAAAGVSYQRVEHDGQEVTRFDAPDATRVQLLQAVQIFAGHGLTLNLPPDWDGFAIAASATSLYLKLLLYAPANLFTAIMAQLQTYHSEERLLLHFSQCAASMPEGQAFTVEEIAEINGLLEQHNFAGRI